MRDELVRRICWPTPRTMRDPIRGRTSSPSPRSKCRCSCRRRPGPQGLPERPGPTGTPALGCAAADESRGTAAPTRRGRGAVCGGAAEGRGRRYVGPREAPSLGAAARPKRPRGAAVPPDVARVKRRAVVRAWRRSFRRRSRRCGGRCVSSDQLGRLGRAPCAPGRFDSRPSRWHGRALSSQHDEAMSDGKARTRHQARLRCV